MENEALRRKYFYRTAEWDWITKDQIHVIDGHAARLITMDHWPQSVFLAATGERTVQQFISALTRRYPTGSVPKQLEAVIFEELHTLLQERLVALSDDPIVLERAIMEPRTEAGRIDLLGMWVGTYAYSDPQLYPPSFSKAPVEFEIVIERVQGDRFFGRVKDTSVTGGTPGTGTITGRVVDDAVEFVKQMPISQHYGINGKSTTNANKPHRPLHYAGLFSRSKKQLTGTWRFKSGWLWKGLLPYRVSYGTGTWTMSKLGR